MTFLSGYLLFGLALAAVPLIIHLLNRRRFELVEWAPMKYLKLTIRSNRRRMRIEQLILLLLRTLAIVLLVLIVARPVLSRQASAAWLSHRSRVSRVIVLDNSLAMGYRHNGRTALDLGKAAVVELLGATGAQDGITLLTTTPASTPLVRDASVENAGSLVTRVDALNPTDAACDWAATFHTIDDSLVSTTFPQKELVLVTDLRRSGWKSGVTELANRWASAGITARIIDVGVTDTANVSLPAFVQEDPFILPGAPARLMATVRNDTSAQISGAQAVLSVDGKPQPVMLPDLPPGSTTDVPLSVTLQTPGPHTVKLALPDDALPGDNARFLSLDVREKLDLSIVDGRQTARPFESAGDFLHLALTAGADPWHVRQFSDADPEASQATPPDVLAVADVASLSPALAARYEKLVRAGMGLMIFPGEQLEPDAWNERLFNNGAGLLPARLARPIDGPVRGVVVEPYGDSPLAPLAKLLPAALAKIEARRLLVVDIPKQSNDTVRVLARWNDAEGHPAVIEKRLGRGRVLLWTVSADREWSDWPVDPTYVLAIRSAAVAVARPDSDDHNLVAGHLLGYRAPDDRVMNAPRITVPDDPTPQPIVAAGAELTYPHTERAGTYTMSWSDEAGKPQSRELCVSFDKNASDLERISLSQLSDLLGNLKPEVVPYQPGILSAAGPGREIWRTLAAVLAGMFLVESLLAFWVGRER